MKEDEYCYSLKQHVPIKQPKHSISFHALICMAEHSFSITVDADGEERILRIQSNNHEDGKTHFTVSSGSETFGILNKHPDGTWNWKNGKSGNLDANIIGRGIEEFLTS